MCSTGSGSGQTNFLLLIVPVLKLPLQLPIHNLGNWQHLTKLPLYICVCVYSYCTVFLCFLLSACAHALSAHRSASTCVLKFVSVYNHVCLRLFACRLSFWFCSVPSVCFCSSVLFVAVHTIPLSSLPPFVSSLSLYLPHRLPITLHKARITQATPFHLLSSSSFLNLALQFKALSPSSAKSILCLFLFFIFFHF